MTDSTLFFLLLLPFVSFLYASVGHGGASGYLALMALFSFSTATMKQTALVLNLFVAGIAFYHYYRAGHFTFSLFIWFALGSIPAAFVGGLFSVDPSVYKKILGVLLLFAVFRMLFTPSVGTYTKALTPLLAVLVGGLIGFFSGLIGIGGGIILSPVLLLFHWAKIKEAAAVSALFIWVNSGAALLGQWSTGISLSLTVLPLIGVALVGGFLGSYYGARKWNKTRLQQFLAVVLIGASFKLLLL